jgi:GxxExxY protein
VNDGIQRQTAGRSEVATRFAHTTYKIIGAAMKVHSQLGPGLREIMYQRALSSAFRDAGLAYEEEKPFQITLDDEQVGLIYLDHFVEDTVVVEEKAFSHLLTNDEVGQVITYLAATQAPVGLLLNFGRRKLEYKRILPPKRLREWQGRVGRYIWQPRETRVEVRPDSHPLIRSLSADDLRPSHVDEAHQSLESSVAHPLIRSLSADDRPAADPEAS